MEAFELLEQLRGHTLDSVHLELLRRIFEIQRSTMDELETANLALTRRNNELQERLQRFEAQAARMSHVLHTGMEE